jgi:di/tricarboxylate transporter
VDVVAICVMLTLPLLGLISGEAAFAGLSSNAVVSIIAVIIIGAGLDRTGIMNHVVKPITHLAGNSESRLIMLVSSTVAFISSFMQNIGAVALFLPATRRVCQKMGVASSRVLMPMGFLGIIGGCLTLVGSSPLILLNDLLLPQKLEPFGLFDVTPIGLVLVAAALGYFVLFGKMVLPSATGQTETAPASIGSNVSGGLYELNVISELASDKTLEELAIRPNYIVTVVAIARRGRHKEKIFAPTRDERLRASDIIAVFGMKENVERMAQDMGMVLQPRMKVFAKDLAPSQAGLIDVVLPPHSDLVDISMRSIHFRKKFQVSPLAVKRQDKIHYGGLADLVLKPGDFLVLFGQWDRFSILKESKNFVFFTPFEEEVMKTHKASMALLSFGLALGLVMTGWVPLSVCLLTGALAMILTGVLSIDDAYKAVDWRTVFLLAGLIPLGVAAQLTGTASYIANGILNALGPLSPLALLTVIAILTSVFTLVISNVGATVLLVPLAINMAMKAGADPRMAALTVAVAASNTFILPTHQVNAFVMGPGGYKTRDFLKAGGMMTVIYLVALLGSLVLFYGV